MLTRMVQKQTIKLDFRPVVIGRRMLDVLSERSRDVVVSRFGLAENPERMTLEAIGDVYDVTRERIRQIENHAIGLIRKSDVFRHERAAFDELQSVINDVGGLVAERELLEFLGRDESARNHAHFLLVLGEPFVKLKEDDEFHHRWHVGRERAEAVHVALRDLSARLAESDLVSDADLISMFLDALRRSPLGETREDVARRYLSVSKMIGRNPLGEWGHALSSTVRVKGVRDYAYLAIRRHGSPMHFTEVAREITRLFGRAAHEATCHNELIKDRRFVLVGRGLYALAEWGYAGGVVRDVIRAVLERYGPLARGELVEKVLKERYVKENTVLVNLENPRHFKKLQDGTYTFVA